MVIGFNFERVMINYSYLECIGFYFYVNNILVFLKVRYLEYILFRKKLYNIV